MIGEISALGSALCWAGSSTLMKSLARKFEPLDLNLLRCLGASAAFALVIPVSPGWSSFWHTPRLTVLYLALSALIGIFIGDTLYIRALKLVRVTLAFPISQCLWPLMTLAAAVVFLGEPLTWILGGGTALILIGVYLIVSPGKGMVAPGGAGAERTGMGILLLVLASACWTVSISFLKLGLQGISIITANGVRMPVAALALLMLTFPRDCWRVPAAKPLKTLALGGLAGVLSFGVGGIFFLLAIRYAGAGKAAVLGSAAPVFGLPLSILFLKERVTPRLIAGTLLVVLGVGLAV